MSNQSLSIEINMSKLILSSESALFKTESFFYQTKKLAGIDSFILKIGEGIISSYDKISDMQSEGKYFLAETIDKKYSFYFVLGSMVQGCEGVGAKDIIFIEDNSKLEEVKFNDQRVLSYIRQHKIFKIQISLADLNFEQSHLKKLYYISSSQYINFPLLNDKQRNLVEIENQNVLIQGVAGSGKTNVCNNKIIFTACKNYAGKILYTTFSRALLVDTKNKIELYKREIETFIDDYKNNRIIFLDKNHKLAIEKRLGLYIVAENETNVVKKLEQVVEFLSTHIDYFLIEDLAKQFLGEEYKIANEQTFTKQFLSSVTNHQLKSKLERIRNLSYPVIYKEIYGMIFGKASDGGEMLSKEEYTALRQNSFSAGECETIYAVAKEFDKFKKTQNLFDNNDISRILMQNLSKIQKYSLSIVDEVQDFTEVNLSLLKAISIKMFCVGDALQMINPSYFSFAFLKRLMYDEDITNVTELESNYRNNKKIVEILESLGSLNIREFGTHSFVLKNHSVDETTSTNAIYVTDKKFIEKLRSEKFENFTILANDYVSKQSLKQMFPKQEILTISEIKGLERDTVLLFDVLSGNRDKWERLKMSKLNHKVADENSVYRYYFNLFYVGVSRAKHNIFIYESDHIDLFDEFFKQNFENLGFEAAYKKFTDIIGKIDIDDDEILSRINEFIKLGQYDNARFYAGRFENDYQSFQQNEKIDAYEMYVQHGRNREAGIKLWKAGLLLEAKEQFTIAGDTNLLSFLESLENRSQTTLDADIIRYYMDFEDNADARQLILEVLSQELAAMKDKQKSIKNKLKQIKEKKDGK